MMLATVLTLFVMLAAEQADVFKKDMAPLQSAVDGVIASSGAQVMPAGKSRAAYIDGYGVIVTVEIAFEAPQGIFDTPKKPAEVRTLVARRRKDLQEKMTAFVKSRVATTDSIAATDSLAIVIYILNTNPADITNLPMQIVMTAKKDSPQQVAVRELF
jgi:hypothetical protein